MDTIQGSLNLFLQVLIITYVLDAYLAFDLMHAC